MREFAYGTEQQFACLKETLEDENCHVYQCILPECCSPNKARVGFEKNRNTGIYTMYIDKGVHTDRGNKDFCMFLKNGEAKFASLQNLIEFCESLQSLFEDEWKAYETKDAEVIVDAEKLHKLEEEAKNKQIWPEDIYEPLKKIIYGQDEVIEKLAEKIVINQMRKEPQILTVVLLGPTATGKSETAKSLAKIMSDVCERKYGFLEIAGSEFIGEHTVHSILGAPPGYVGHGEKTRLDSVRDNPYHVIVINEIEKAHEKLLISLMEAIDTGKLGMADNSKSIDLKHCILLFTSNIPIDMEKYNSLCDFEKSELCRNAFTSHCGKPEITGKIGNFLAYNPLSDDAQTAILSKFIKEELFNYGIHLKRIEAQLMFDFKQHAKTAYGARGMQELVSNCIGRFYIQTRNFESLKNHSICLSGSINDIKFSVEN